MKLNCVFPSSPQLRFVFLHSETLHDDLSCTSSDVHLESGMLSKRALSMGNTQTKLSVSASVKDKCVISESISLLEAPMGSFSHLFLLEAPRGPFSHLFLLGGSEEPLQSSFVSAGGSEEPIHHQ